jgi:hypothetical protein
MNFVSNTANSKESMHVKYDMSSIKYKMWLQFAIHPESQLKKKDIALCYNVAYL